MANQPNTWEFKVLPPEILKQKRERGNELYKKKQLDAALAAYSEVLSQDWVQEMLQDPDLICMNGVLMMARDVHMPIAIPCMSSAILDEVSLLLLNRCAVHLMVKNYAAALADANMVRG